MLHCPSIINNAAKNAKYHFDTLLRVTFVLLSCKKKRWKNEKKVKRTLKSFKIYGTRVRSFAVRVRVASRDAHDKLIVRYRGAAVSSTRRAAGRAAGRVLIDVIRAM